MRGDKTCEPQADPACYDHLLDDPDEAIVDALSDGGTLPSEVAVVIGLTSRATRTRLARLVRSGLMREVGTRPQDPKRRYFIASIHH